MNTTILLVGHGSRFKAGNREIEKFTQIWRTRNPVWQIELCFIEFAPVLLDAGLDKAAKNGGRVIVVPLILNAAGHVKMEIPHHMDKARQRPPEIDFISARHLGANDKMLAILKRNLRKVMLEMDMPDPTTTGIILLGRGSSDRDANGENAKLARYLFEESQHELVDPAFTGISFPRLETAVQRQIKLGMMQISVLPYYLFSGTLMERIKQQLARLQNQYPQISFALADNFGFEDEIYQLLDERVLEAMANDYNNDTEAHYQQHGENYQHHHHHDHDHNHPQEEAVT